MRTSIAHGIDGSTKLLPPSVTALPRKRVDGASAQRVSSARRGRVIVSEASQNPTKPLNSRVVSNSNMASTLAVNQTSAIGRKRTQTTMAETTSAMVKGGRQRPGNLSRHLARVPRQYPDVRTVVGRALEIEVWLLDLRRHLAGSQSRPERTGRRGRPPSSTSRSIARMETHRPLRAIRPSISKIFSVRFTCTAVSPSTSPISS
ncbi:hypothetical protein SAMN05192583_1028 [Sphingomonas gellani]|uniref:Uncharacterized protein n=1 Tax=Sphingomonas gellani TaxID=1166340 RepID=A0A1H8ATX5_9SPHN|nr:hypothetical protein SAMN05192583_1028 [Sphingomonas gellani]